MEGQRPTDDTAGAVQPPEEELDSPEGKERPAAGPVERAEEVARSVADRMRGSGVGTEDPNIVGDAETPGVQPEEDQG